MPNLTRILAPLDHDGTTYSPRFRCQTPANGKGEHRLYAARPPTTQAVARFDEAMSRATQPKTVAVMRGTFQPAAQPPTTSPGSAHESQRPPRGCNSAPGDGPTGR